jgi:phospholipid/cholesterol/gamma-HCH transport system substrate-binding protein
MESKVNFALVGAFVLVLGAALLGGVLWLSSEKSLRTAHDSYLVYMVESVSGLDPDAAVRYKGVQIGRVRGITLVPGDPERVQLTLEVDRGTPIKQDTVAVLETQGLTGIAHVELSGGTRDSPPLVAADGAPLPVIRSAPSLLLRLDAQVSALLENLNRSSERFNTLLDERNRNALGETLASLRVVARTLAARSAALDAGLADAARAMQNTARLTDQMSRLLQRVDGSVDAFDRMTGAGAQAGASAARAMDSARAELESFSAETLPEARALVVDLESLTATLQRVSDGLERDPGVLLRGKAAPKPGPGE